MYILITCLSPWINLWYYTVFFRHVTSYLTLRRLRRLIKKVQFFFYFSWKVGSYTLNGIKCHFFIFFINWYVQQWNVNVYLLNVQCDYCWWLIILVIETKDEKLWNDLKREFESTPTMVFSVIGDSESFVPKLWQKDVFQTALVEAAKNGGGMFYFLFMSVHCIV